MKKYLIILVLIFAVVGCADNDKSSKSSNNIQDNTSYDNNDINNNDYDNDTVLDSYNKPTADFDFIVNGNIVEFIDKSIDDYGINKWEWNFGFGTSCDNVSDKQNPTCELTFLGNIDDGTYTVKLTVTNEYMQEDTIEKKVTVTGLRASFRTKINDKTVIFTDTSTNKDSSCWLTDRCWKAVKGHWDFGDNSSSNEQNPTHTYQNSGVYDVTLTVYTENNIMHYTTQSITIE